MKNKYIIDKTNSYWYVHNVWKILGFEASKCIFCYTVLCSRYLLNTPSQQNDTQIAGKMTLCQLMFQSFLLFQVNMAVND